MHLWLVAVIYVLALPFQIYTTLGWITIPATGIISFIFFGFLVAGEEIESTFFFPLNLFLLPPIWCFHILPSVYTNG